MTTDLEKVYAFDPLDKFTFGERLVIRAADLVFYAAISIIGKTIRWETEGLEHLDAVAESGRQPIFCLWHERIFAATYYLRGRGIVVITSQSKDGEYIARFLKRLGYGTIRGSSTRGGVGALVEMARAMRRGLAMAFTVDGPRGPRREVKKGAVLLAKKTGNPLLPLGVECESYWTINSWDRMQIPRPFTRAKYIIASPIDVSPGASDEMLDEKRFELQRVLDNIVIRGEEWREKASGGG